MWLPLFCWGRNSSSYFCPQSSGLYWITNYSAGSLIQLWYLKTSTKQRPEYGTNKDSTFKSLQIKIFLLIAVTLGLGWFSWACRQGWFFLPFTFWNFNFLTVTTFLTFMISWCWRGCVSNVVIYFCKRAGSIWYVLIFLLLNDEGNLRFIPCWCMLNTIEEILYKHTSSVDFSSLSCFLWIYSPQNHHRGQCCSPFLRTGCLLSR